MRHLWLSCHLLIFAAAAAAAPGPGSLAILCADGGCVGAQARFTATARFTSVDVFDITSSTPTLAAVQGYGNMIVWTNNNPADGSAVGNLLADYYDLGGKHLTICTYSFSAGWAISGRVMTGNYVGLQGGSTGDVSGNFQVMAPSDPIFTGLDLTGLAYFHNGNFSHPTLAPGASLLATDGSGVYMMARSSNGVINANLFPGDIGSNNAKLYELLASAVLNGGSGGVAPVPSLSFTGGLILIMGLFFVGYYSLERRTA